MENLILNRYQPIEEAGRGGFGTVVVAWDTRMRRKVAIKMIKLQEIQPSVPAAVDVNASTQIIYNNNSAPTQIINNLNNPKSNNAKSIDESGEHWEDSVPGLTEARTAAMIQDANIVTVHDFEVDNGFAYIIMEYVEGITLSDFLDNYGNEMTLDMLTCIFNGVAHALEVAHANNVLHLDIKPDNVLIDQKGKVKVTDFGLATLADEFGHGTANAGTIGYMPPEQMRRSQLDTRTDQWALACLTYEMLCGCNPFNADDLQSALKIAQDAKLRLPSSCWEDIDTDLDHIIFRALSPDPVDRFESVKEFHEELNSHFANPRAGQRQLSALFKEQSEQASPNQLKVEQHEKSKIMEGLTGSIAKNIFGRIFSVASVAPIAILGCFNIEYLGGHNPNLFGIIAIIAILGLTAAFSVLGATLACVGLSVAFILTGNFIIAGVLLLISILWCVYSFSIGMRATNTTASYSLFGCFGFAQFGPFATGLFNDVKESIINCGFGFVLCLILAGLGSKSLVGWEPMNNYDFISTGFSSYGGIQDDLLQLVSKASIWVWAASWITASAVIAFCFSFSNRAVRIIGPIAGTVIMIAGICIADYLISGSVSWQPQGWEILPTIIAGVLATIIAAILPQRNYIEQ